jgi:hypothetical protein
MSYTKISNVYCKAVKNGIIDQRSIPYSKKKQLDYNWFCVRLNYKTGYFFICGKYKTELEARKQMDKVLRYSPMFIIEKTIFESCYSFKDLK